jgi:hypothetical protein
MKLISSARKNRRHERGSAVMLVMTMLGIMTIFVAMNTVAIRTLSTELKLIEKKQVRRLQAGAAAQAVSVTSKNDTK